MKGHTPAHHRSTGETTEKSSIPPRTPTASLVVLSPRTLMLGRGSRTRASKVIARNFPGSVKVSVSRWGGEEPPSRARAPAWWRGLNIATGSKFSGRLEKKTEERSRLCPGGRARTRPGTPPTPLPPPLQGAVVQAMHESGDFRTNAFPPIREKGGDPMRNQLPARSKPLSRRAASRKRATMRATR